ncbi:MAG: hypothetical protein V4621_05320 [Pseudomonadota bacterium]
MADGNMTDGVIIDVADTAPASIKGFASPRDIFQTLASPEPLFASIGKLAKPDKLHGNYLETYNIFDLPIKAAGTPIFLPAHLAHLREAITIMAHSQAQNPDFHYADCHASLNYSVSEVVRGKTNLGSSQQIHIDTRDFDTLIGNRYPRCSSYIVSTPALYTTCFFTGPMLLDKQDILTRPRDDWRKATEDAIANACQKGKRFYPAVGEIIAFHECSPHNARLVHETTRRAVLIVDFEREWKPTCKAALPNNKPLYDFMVRNSSIAPAIKRRSEPFTGHYAGPR